MTERLGRYELLHLLGEGGMGRVWEAELRGPAGFRKRVALKVLKEGGRGLVQEARLGGLLRHPNLVEVYALEQVGDQWVCAMELVRGGTLRAHLPLPPRAVVDVALQVCAGLDKAHREIGLVHLDLKPDNLLLDGSVVKVADLGVARAHGVAADRRTAGTPTYMAPEQRRGAGVDARADVWGLGVVMVELATGRAGHDPTAVPALRPVLERCLGADPNTRFRSMAELAEALAALDPPGAGLAETLGGRQRTTTGPRATPRSRGTDTFLLAADPVTNLGGEPDAFVGREAERERLAAALDRPGLVTLKGAGGLGKTRLARRVARDWHDRTGGQAWFVDLADAATEVGLLGAVGAVLGVPIGGSEAVERLGHAVAGRGASVIVLDNFEQLVACAPVVARWRELAPEARWLVTSREPLGVRGEEVVELGPLPVEAASELLRARAAQLGVTLADDDPDLRALAERLDGLPLALELAASRLTVLRPAGVLARLDDRLRVLASARRDLGPRQATLRGALDWSWDLLDPAEREGFAQCAVFVGGFTVEAAEAVLEVPGGVWALDVVESLLRKSLVTQRDGRLVLFETTRAYAAEKLADDGAARRHATWFGRFGAEEAVRARATDPRRMRELHRERGNLVAAVERGLALGETAAAADAFLAVSEIFEEAGPLAAWSALCERVRAADVPGIHRRGRLERATARVADLSGRSDAAVAHCERALELHRSEGDIGAEGIALNNLAMVLSDRGEHQRALELLDQAIARLREAGDRRFEGIALGNLGSLCTEVGRADEALRNQRAALERLEAVGDVRAAGRALANLGNVYGARGDREEAVTSLERAIANYRQVGAPRLEAIALGNLTLVLGSLGQHEAAEARCAEAIELLRRVGDRRNLGVSMATLANVRMDAGKLAEARESAIEAVALLTQAGDAVWAAIASGYLGRIALREGDAVGAVVVLEAAVAGVAGRHALAHAGLSASLAEARVLAGERERGLAELREAVGRLEAVGYREELAAAREALARLG